MSADEHRSSAAERPEFVGFGDGGKWVYVKPSGYPFAASTQLNPGWLGVWTKVSL